MKSYKQFLIQGKKEKFGIRKTTLGILSLMLGASLILAPQIVSAEETVNTSPTSSQTVNTGIDDFNSQSGVQLSDAVKNSPLPTDVQDNREVVENNNYTRVNAAKRSAEVDGATTNTNLSTTKYVDGSYTELVNNLNQNGFTVEEVEKEVPSDQASLEAVKEESKQEAEKIKQQLMEKWSEYERIREEKRNINSTAYERFNIDQEMKKDYEELMSSKGDAIREAMKNQNLHLGNEENARVAITGEVRYLSEAKSKEFEKPANEVDYSNLRFQKLAKVTRNDYVSSQLGDTGVQRVVFRESDRITVTYTNLSNSYMIVDGKQKKIAKIVRTFELERSLGSNHNVLAEVDANPYNGVLFGSDVARGGTQRIVAKSYYYDENGQELDENTGKTLYAVHEMYRYTVHKEYGTGHRISNENKFVAHIEYTDANGETKTVNEVLSPEVQTGETYVKSTKLYSPNQRVRVFRNVSHYDETGLPEGDEITSTYDGFNELNSRGETIGRFTILNGKNIFFESAELRYTPEPILSPGGHWESITLNPADKAVQIPGSGVKNFSGTINPETENFYNLNNYWTKVRYKVNSSEYKLGWNSPDKPNYYYGSGAFISRGKGITLKVDGDFGYGVSQRFRLSTEIYLPKEVKGSEHASDYYSKTPNPTVRVTRWMANLPESTLTKSEFSQVLTFANTNGEEVHAPIVRNYTLLHVKPADHGVNEFGLGPSELPVSGLENPFGFGGPQQPRVTPKSLYYDFLLTKEEEAEVYKNFHETGEVYFMRNGEKITPHEMDDHFKWDGDEESLTNPYTPGVYTPEQTLPTVENNKLAGFRMLLEYKGNKKWTGVVGFTDKEVQNGVTLPKSWVGENPEIGITIARQHFIYETTAKPTIHELPTDAPSVTPEAREVTRFVRVNEQGEEVEVAETQEGTLPAPSIIGDYQFDHTTPNDGTTGITSHYYVKIQTTVPNEAPKMIGEVSDVTRFVTVGENGVEEEIAPALEGVHEAPAFLQNEKYHFSGQTKVEDGIHTHYYDLVKKDKPIDAPSVTPEIQEVTRYLVIEEDGSFKAIRDEEKGTLPAPMWITDDSHQYFFDHTDSNDGVTGITTHYYRYVTSEKPVDVPSVTPEMCEVTRYIAVTDNGEVEVKPAEEGTHEALMYVGDFQYNGKTIKEDGVTTHYYDRSVSEIPENAPISDFGALNVTRFVTVENGVEREIAPTVKGVVLAPLFIGEHEEYVYSKLSKVEDHISTHYYVRVEKQVPGDFPTVETPEKVLSENPTEVPIAENEALEVTRWVTVLEDGSLKEIKPTEKGTHAAPLFIGSREDYHYNGKTTLEESVTTHYYDAVEKGIPGDAPVAENPEKVFTEVPNEAPVHELPEKVLTEVPGEAPIHELPEKVLTEVPNEAPVHELPEKVLTEVPGDAPIHELPELVVTEVPKDAPVHELEELKIPEEPKKDETPAPVPSVIKTEVPKKELPKTGQKEETGTLQALGAILGLAALGLTMKSKKKED